MRPIRDVFDKLIGMNDAEREEYLATQADLDTDVVQAVRRLLEADKAGDHLPLLQQALSQTGSENADTPAVGDSIGSYKLVRRLGEGGSGVVYEAVREDDGIRMRVAIKLLHHELCTPEYLPNLRCEAEALARLRHPLISRLLDWDLGSDAASYYVFDFIDGEPITSWCWNRRLPEAERLKLFMELCVAVAYAHQNMIGHFDLKPQNVLVNEHGDVRLIDFSIARNLLSDDFSGNDVVAVRGFTPRYASPEQVRGEVLTSQSDVYSLGVLLKEILGEGTENESASKWPLPDTLMAIVRHATAKDREQRYETVEQLKNDVGSYLHNFPIQGIAPEKFYHARLFIRRNMFRLTLWAMAILILGTGAGYWRMSEKAKEEQLRSQKLEKSIHDFTDTLLGPLQEEVINSPGATPVRMMVMHTGVAFLNDLLEQSHNNPDLAVELAEAYTRLGDIQGNPAMPNLGDEKDAKISYETARQLLSKQTMAQSRLPYGILLTHEGDLIGAGGDHRTAEQMYVDAVRILSSSKSVDGRQTAYHEALASALIDLGDEQCDDRDENSARANYSHAVEIARVLSEAVPDSITYQRLYARSQDRLGDLESSLGHWQTAAAIYQKGLSVYEGLIKLYPQNQRVRHSWVAGTNDLALAYEHIERLQDALTLYQQVNKVVDRNAQNDPRNTAAQRDLQVSESNLERVFVHLGRLTDAEQANHREIALAEAFYNLNRNDSMARSDLADALEYAAKIHSLQHDFRQSILIQDRVLKLMRENLQVENSNSKLGSVIDALIHGANYRMDAAANSAGKALLYIGEARKYLAELDHLVPHLNPTFEDDRERIHAIGQLAARLQALHGIQTAKLDSSSRRN